MKKEGVAYLPLHSGKAPPWLFNRMVKLGKNIFRFIIDDFGSSELIYRLSDPFWFQALGCALGFDYHSSGVTTVLTGVMEKVFSEEDLGIFVVGGKGRRFRNISVVLKNKYADLIGSLKTEKIVEASKLSIYTDTMLLQDRYILYHHAIVFSEDGKWIVIQQGMNMYNKYARRYHIIDEKFEKDLNYISEPHGGIIGNTIENTILDLTSRESIENKKTMLDIVKEENIRRDYEKLLEHNKNTLYRWIPKLGYSDKKIDETKLLYMPRKIDWRIVRKMYEEQPQTIPELLKIPGMNTKIVRAISLIADLIYGEEASWKDPIKYTFAVGGKDGVPFPVDRKTYDKTIKYFQDLIDGSELEGKEKKKMIRRLDRLSFNVR